ncbi:MAG: hypothetical protein KDA91_08065 [Planctomycetaceae bacterium]|nr:hypothetical protein [Planctomycetaceae bacterium]
MDGIDDLSDLVIDATETLGDATDGCRYQAAVFATFLCCCFTFAAFQSSEWMCVLLSAIAVVTGIMAFWLWIRS